MALIVSTAPDGVREQVMMRWGFPRPPTADVRAVKMGSKPRARSPGMSYRVGRDRGQSQASPDYRFDNRPEDAGAAAEISDLIVEVRKRASRCERVQPYFSPPGLLLRDLLASLRRVAVVTVAEADTAAVVTLDTAVAGAISEVMAAVDFAGDTVMAWDSGWG